MSTVEAQLSAIKEHLAREGDAKAWSVLWVISAIELTAQLSSTESAFLALGALRAPSVRALAPTYTTLARGVAEGGDSTLEFTPLEPFAAPTEATNAILCAISTAVIILCEVCASEAPAVMRDCYDAVLCVKRPASKRILGWLRAESERRGLAWPPPRVERDYLALCAELTD